MNYKLRNLPHRLRGWRAELLRAMGYGGLSELSVKVIRGDGTVEDFGVVSRRVVTDAGVAFLTDCFMNTAEPENMNWHDCGTGVAAEAVGNTALGTSFGGARVSGTQSKPTAPQYRTVATITPGGVFAITEHGIFSASSVGTLLDRSVFAAINVTAPDSIQFTYTFTITSGG